MYRLAEYFIKYDVVNTFIQHVVNVEFCAQSEVAILLECCQLNRSYGEDRITGCQSIELDSKRECKQIQGS